MKSKNVRPKLTITEMTMIAWSIESIVLNGEGVKSMIRRDFLPSSDKPQFVRLMKMILGDIKKSEDIDAAFEWCRTRKRF